MKAELKTKWVEALRSGKYKQGRGSLRPEVDAYCCLGVMCDVVSADKWDPAPHFGATIHHELKFGDPKNNGFTSTGLKDTEADVLVDMNDIEQRDFAYIANWIESNIPAE